MLTQITRLALGASAMTLIAAGSIIASAGAANATPACAGFNVSTTAGSNSCTADGLTFTFTDLSFVPSAMGDAVSISSANLVSGNVELEFQIAGAPGDIFVQYSVSGPSIVGIDNEFGANGDMTSINETVCTDAVPLTKGSSGCPMGDTQLAHLVNTTGGVTDSASFAPQSDVLISKDVVDTTDFSDFADSILLQTQRTLLPEPVTISLFGAGLAGIGLAVRRRKAAKKA